MNCSEFLILFKNNGGKKCNCSLYLHAYQSVCKLDNLFIQLKPFYAELSLILIDYSWLITSYSFTNIKFPHRWFKVLTIYRLCLMEKFSWLHTEKFIIYLGWPSARFLPGLSWFFGWDTKYTGFKKFSWPFLGRQKSSKFS